MAESAPQPHLSRESLRMVLGGFTRTAACALVTVALAQPAAAQQAQDLLIAQDRPIMFLVGSSATWNSNLFLTPNNVQSDFYFTPYVGLRIDKTYAQQRFLLDVTETFYRYSRLSALNASAFSYAGAWLWHLSPRVSGTISGGRSESVNNFSFFQGTPAQSFTVTTENQNGTLDGWIFGGWHLLAGGSNFKSTNSQQFQALGDYSLYGMSDTGVKYVAGSGSWIAAVNRWSQGSYFNQPVDPVAVLDHFFQEQENGLKSTWILGGKSTVNTRLSWLARRYQNFSQRNFSGPRGQITYSLGSASDKLRLNLGFTREIAAFLTDQSSYTITNTVSVIPSWQASPKIAVHMDFERATWDFRGPVFPSPFPLREDTVLSALLGVDWTPFYNVALGASVQRSRRSSNIFANEYNDTLANINASLKF